MTISDLVDSVVADIEGAGFGDVVVVGHSIGGLTVPGIVTKLGAARVREMVLAAAFVPPQGLSVADRLGGPLAPLARSGRSPKVGDTQVLARYAFCNGMSARARVRPIAAGAEAAR